MIKKMIAAAVLFAFSLMLPLAADTLPFRSGEILSAELSTVKPKIANEDPLAFPLDFSRRIYAAMVVKVAEGRGISIHDYALTAFGREFPCIALRVGDKEFDAKEWKVERAKPTEKYTLLFALDATVVGFTANEKLLLRSLYPPKSRAEQSVPFRNLNGKAFTAPRSVPAAGLMPKAGEQ